MNAAIVIPICCVCNRVREHVHQVDQKESWDTLGVFLNVHHISSGEYQLTHTYCPDCAAHFSKFFKPEGQTMREDVTPLSMQDSAAAAILDVFTSVQKCDLDMLVRACPTLTWNQVFSEVDRLSRSGQLRLSYLGHGQYSVELPENSDISVMAQT